MRVLLGFALLAACSHATPPQVTTADAVRANVELAQLTEGRTLLLQKCGTCHRVPLPTAQAKPAWPKVLDEMATRAKIDTRERQLILQYLVVMMDAPPPAAK